MFADIGTLPRAGNTIPASHTPCLTLAAPDQAAQPFLDQFGALYGGCPAMRQLFATIERAAPTSATAMILGESGSGKELVARRIHELSARSEHPFVAVNCGALPETLIESELFGHERGSFTGAARTHHGCFERADKGTLFLDEISEMPTDMQVRLLRVLETGRFTRVGGDREIATDVRLIAATNRDLKAAVADGRLREDLMYRLCVIPIDVPALRDREGDALLLAEMFLQEHNRDRHMRKRLSAAARQRIMSYDWPGNVRELRNVVHRAFVLCDGEVDVDLEVAELRPAGMRATAGEARVPSSPSVSVPLGTSLDEAERVLILATLDAVKGSKTEAAKVLGISLKTLYNRLQAYRGRASAAAPSVRCRLAVVA